MEILLGNLALSCLVSGAIASLGVLTSLKASTVQSAQQTLMLTAMVPLVLIQSLAFLLPTFIPIETLRGILVKINFNQILLIVLGILLAANAVLFTATAKKFQRSKLSLDES